MRERSLIQSILDIALQRAGGRRITDVHLAVGQLFPIADEAVRLYWDTLAKGTLAEGARLHFKHLPAELQCMACFEKYHPKGEEVRCPKCGSVGAKVLAGEEFRLEAVEVE